MCLSEQDSQETISRYQKRYHEHGYSPKTLGWEKGKQMIRFERLTSLFHTEENPSLLDVGCGFGDLNKLLKIKYNESYSYQGIDLVEQLVNEGRRIFENERVKFSTGDFLKMDFQEKYDYVISSGMFNYKFTSTDNYSFTKKCMDKAFSLCNVGFAFDFLSDKAAYKHGHTFHSSPEKILSMAYELTRNVVLRNDYMPFEFCIILFKDDSFSEDDTLFTGYKRSPYYERANH